MKSSTKENIKQIATTKNYTTNVYIGSNDDEFISAINKSLIKQINGTLELTVNNGTQFKIKFPINQEYVGYK